jgi:hypothetical protein
MERTCHDLRIDQKAKNLLVILLQNSSSFLENMKYSDYGGWYVQ